MSQRRIAVLVPTLNTEMEWSSFSSALLSNVEPETVIVIDSTSSDRTKQLAEASGFSVREISRSEFDHGGTRQLGVTIASDAEIVVFLTQDAVLAQTEAIDTLVRAFDDPAVGAAYGRQLPRRGAKPVESHARYFNYPAQSVVRSLSDRVRYGFKSIFISNSFAAYRRSALEAVGGFPSDVLFGEDTITAARLLIAGWKIAYVAEAAVYHSHSYTWRQEFRRYFDIGVLHTREHWLGDEFGATGGEGARFVRSELRYRWPRHWRLIPSTLICAGRSRGSM